MPTSATVPVKSFCGVTVTVLFAVSPGRIDEPSADAETEKSPAGAGVTTDPPGVNAAAVFGVPRPVGPS